jgi:outer membrane protein OmpA-like peptidoglycan-associated protein
MREQIMKRAGSATVGIEAQSSVDRSSGSESELSYQRSRTVVPVTPAQGVTGQHQQPLMGKDVSGAAPATGVQNFSGSHSPEIGRSGAVTAGFVGVNEGPGKNFVSDGINFIRQSPPPKLETIPSHVTKEPVSYQITDTWALAFKMKEFKEQLKIAQQALTADVTYEFGKATMDSKTRAALSEVAKAIQMLDTLPGLEKEKITIHGHTDSKAGWVINSKGERERFDNQKLSEERANSLRDALIAMGVPEERLATVGHGASQPIAPNETTVNGRTIDNPDGRALNRRSELSFSMTEVEYQAYLRETEARFVRESTKTVTEEKVVEVPRPVVNHQEIVPHEKRSGGDPTFAAALEKICSEKVDLKIPANTRRPSPLALRAEKDPDGNYLLSVYSGKDGDAMQTAKFSPSGSFLGKSAVRVPNLLFGEIKAGLNAWANPE